MRWPNAEMADLGSLHCSVAYECSHVNEQSCCIVRREVNQTAPRKTVLVCHVRDRKRWSVEKSVVFGEFDLGEDQTFEASAELIHREHSTLHPPMPTDLVERRTFQPADGVELTLAEIQIGNQNAFWRTGDDPNFLTQLEDHVRALTHVAQAQ